MVTGGGARGGRRGGGGGRRPRRGSRAQAGGGGAAPPPTGSWGTHRQFSLQVATHQRVSSPATRPVSRPATVSRSSSTQPRPRSGPSGAGDGGDHVDGQLHRHARGRSGCRRRAAKELLTTRQTVVGGSALASPTGSALAVTVERPRRRRGRPAQPGGEHVGTAAAGVDAADQFPAVRRRWPAAAPRSRGSPAGPARRSPRRAAPARRAPAPGTSGARRTSPGRCRRRGPAAARSRTPALPPTTRRGRRCTCRRARSTSCLIRPVSSSALCAAV